MSCIAMVISNEREYFHIAIFIICINYDISISFCCYYNLLLDVPCFVIANIFSLLTARYLLFRQILWRGGSVVPHVTAAPVGCRGCVTQT